MGCPILRLAPPRQRKSLRRFAVQAAFGTDLPCLCRNLALINGHERWVRGNRRWAGCQKSDGKLQMTKLFAGAAAAILFAGVAYAGEPAVETEVVEAEAAVEAVEVEATGEAEAVEVVAEAEAEAAPAEAAAEEGVTEEAAPE